MLIKNDSNINPLLLLISMKYPFKKNNNFIFLGNQSDILFIQGFRINKINLLSLNILIKS